jgi:hypothetical protein
MEGKIQAQKLTSSSPASEGNISTPRSARSNAAVRDGDPKVQTYPLRSMRCEAKDNRAQRKVIQFYCRNLVHTTNSLAGRHEGLSRDKRQTLTHSIHEDSTSYFNMMKSVTGEGGDDNTELQFAY